MGEKRIKILFRDDTEEINHIDEYGVKDVCLCTYVRFGVDAGT